MIGFMVLQYPYGEISVFRSTSTDYTFADKYVKHIPSLCYEFCVIFICESSSSVITFLAVYTYCHEFC